MSQKRSLLAVCVLLVAVVLFGVASAGRVGAQDPPVTPPAPRHQPKHHVAAPETIQAIDLSPLATDTGITDLIARVHGDRWHDDVTTLAEFDTASGLDWGTRYTYSQGNLDARDWISSTLAALGWTASFHAFKYNGGTRYNVIGERAGNLYPENIYIVSAHFDSRAQTSDQSEILAPGAEDNGSGTAALLEIARVLQDQTPASTIRLAAFTAEEQGLNGSTAYVNYLRDVTGELDNVKGVYNLDMVGYTSNPANVHVVLESYDPNNNAWMGNFREHLASMAETYTDLDVYYANGGCCSDHVPFLWEQVPAVLLIGAEWSSYPYYHTIDDVPDNVVPAEGEAIIQAVVAALAEKAGIVCMLADLDCNGAVELTDVVDLAAHWRLSLGEPGFADKYDLNDDVNVNVIDLQLAAQALVQ